MEKLKMHTPDLTQDHIARIRELFPNCVTEARDESGKVKLSVDFNQLKQELSDSIVEGPQERYHLNWPGKREALLTANAPIAKTLRPARAESVDFDTTKNLFIEGDNLEALKLLQETYLGKVKMIYIDPPYNTGNDFLYDDDFEDDTESFLVKSNQKDESGDRLVANTESNGRFHSDWLSFIYPRLKLARNLLKDDGAIFISIDDSEQENLKKIASEIFGDDNFIAEFVWAAGRKNDSKHVSVSHEYILVYAKNKEFLKAHNIQWRVRKTGLDEIYSAYGKIKKTHGDDYASMTAALRQWYSGLSDGHPAKRHKHYNTIDHCGVYFPADISWPGGGGPKYEVLHPKTGQPCKIPSRGWMFGDAQKMKEAIADDKVHFGEDEDSVPCIKAYLKDSEEEVPYSVFYQDGRASTKRLRTLLGDDVFSHPKDEEVLAELIEACTEKGDIICDFFAGSCTTAHSTFIANQKQSVSRQFIMVQLAEVIDSSKATGKRRQLLARAENFLNSIKKPRTIAEISKERIRRAGKTFKGDTGFRVLKIDTSNMAEVYYTPDGVKQDDLLAAVDNIRPDRSPEDLLFQVLLDWGVDLTLPIAQKTVQGKTVFFVDGNALAACFDAGITEELVKELAAEKPLRVVFRDNGFASDAVKINAEQIFKQMSPGTDMKSI
jgi:adenine-specific DNA-methyltransferase